MLKELEPDNLMTYSKTENQTKANYENMSMTNLLTDMFEKHASRTALFLKDTEKTIQLTFKDLDERAKQLASYLIELGIKPNDRIAILSESRPEWGICFFGSIRAGATVVPLDIKLMEAEFHSILSDSQPRILFVSGEFLAIAKQLADTVKSIEYIYIVEEKQSAEKQNKDSIQNITSLKAKKDLPSIDRKQNETALIVYTSGTTGNPKGVMVSFQNILFEVMSFENIIGVNEELRYLSILPLNHLLELTAGFMGVLAHGGTVYFCHTLYPQEIIKAMREYKITGMIAVPLFLKTLKSAIEREIRRKGEDELKKFTGAMLKAPSLSLSERRKVFHNIHEQFGGELSMVVSGGAPLDIDVAKFFDNIGISILQGYGLTETSPVICVNRLEANRLGSVGLKLEGVDVKIDLKDSKDTEGEILTRGPHVMKGYYKRDDLTAEVIDEEGWFHTGDLGHLDKDDFLFITGRIKNLIVLGGGKKVFPEEVEAALSQVANLKELCILGQKTSDGFKEGTEEVIAVVVPSDKLAKEYEGKENELPSVIKKELEPFCNNLAPYKRPTRIFLHPNDLPKTATRKVKRKELLDWLKGNNKE
jgi:long-chain acyl-CoA synthetase